MTDCFKTRASNATAVYPSDSATYVNTPGYFQPFSACDASDGTPLTPEWLNNLIQNLEAVVDFSGVDDTNCADVLYRAIFAIAESNAASASTTANSDCVTQAEWDATAAAVGGTGVSFSVPAGENWIIDLAVTGVQAINNSEGFYIFPSGSNGSITLNLNNNGQGSLGIVGGSLYSGAYVDCTPDFTQIVNGQPVTATTCAIYSLTQQSNNGDHTGVLTLSPICKV